MGDHSGALYHVTPSHGAEARTAPQRLSDGSEDMSAHKMLAQKHSRRENVRDKAKRLLVSGRLRVVKVDGNLIIAKCKGDSGEMYDLGHEPGAAKAWRCTCVYLGPCSHLIALQSVTAVER